MKTKTIYPPTPLTAAEQATKATRPFQVGDRVVVLYAIHLPRELVKHVGTIRKVQERDGGLETLYWIDGLPTARTADVLRRPIGPEVR